jgi:hypothetical protein
VNMARAARAARFNRLRLAANHNQALLC